MKPIEDHAAAHRRLPPTPSPLTTLPPPDAAAEAHSRRVIDHLQRVIAAAGGAIPFSRYMHEVLYAPGLGYYSAGSRKFGRDGDFITAPELSDLFSLCLARQCGEVLAAVGGGLLEFGAGSGRMAAAMLLQLERIGQLPDHYYILEVSAELRQRQRETLVQRAPHLLSRVEWLDRLPENFVGVVVANEVVDAMPVHSVCREDGAWHERYVAWDGQRFVWQPGPLSEAALQPLLEQLGPLPQPYCSEVNLLARQWLTQLATALTRGAVLLIDYGFPRREYYHPERSEGSLMCHYRHRAHGDPFVYPGLQDLTAHVDFTALAQTAVAAGLEVLGYTTQAMFLMATGLEQALEGVDDTVTHYNLVQQIKTLTLPSEMGELFKVLALGKGALPQPLLGFRLHDARGKL